MSVFDELNNTGVTDFPSFPSGFQNAEVSAGDRYLSEFAKTKPFGNLNSKEIVDNYFVGINPMSFNKKIVYKEEETKVDINPKKFTLYKEKNNKAGFQIGEDELLYSLKVYVSIDGNKIENLYNSSKGQVADNEILFFLEDNTDDFSDQILLARFGENVNRKELLRLSEKGLEKFTSQVPDLNKEKLKTLISTGKVTAKSKLNADVVKGLFYVTEVYSGLFKGIGWVFNEIGDAINTLAIPENIWNPDHSEYVLKKHKLIEVLQIDTGLLDSIDSILEPVDTLKLILGFLPDKGVSFPKKIINSLRVFVENYNKEVTTKINEIYKTLEDGGKAINDTFYITEQIAFLSGIWNGIVDFFAGIFKFIGLLLNLPNGIIKNYQSILETLDSFVENIKKVSIKELYEGTEAIKFLIFIELYKFFTAKNPDEIYNFDKIAYFTGFGLTIALSFFIPQGAVTKFTKLDKLIPEEFLSALKSAQKDAIDFTKDKSAKAFDEGLKIIQAIGGLLAKGKDGLIDLFNVIKDKIIKWISTNKALFAKLNNILEILLRNFEIAKKTITLLKDLGVVIVRNTIDDFAPKTQTVVQAIDGQQYTVLYGGKKILEGTNDVIKAFGKKVDEIRTSSGGNGKNKVKNYLEDIALKLDDDVVGLIKKQGLSIKKNETTIDLINKNGITVFRGKTGDVKNYVDFFNQSLNKRKDLIKLLLSRLKSNSNKYNRNNAIDKGYDIPLSKNRTSPDFDGLTDYLYKEKVEYGRIKINITGSRNKDFKAAFEKIGIKDLATQAKIKRKYTWHHVDDLDENLIGTMQLILKEAHKATYKHLGTPKQFTTLLKIDKYL